MTTTAAEVPAVESAVACQMPQLDQFKDWPQISNVLCVLGQA
jgi:hypothetical protein